MSRLLTPANLPALAALVALLVLGLQNRGSISVDFLAFEFLPSKAELVLIAALLGVVVGARAGFVLARRK